MNRIYRRIWNKAKQCWVVTSELAASCSTGGRLNRRRLLARCALPSLMLGVVGSASAQSPELETRCNVEETWTATGCQAEVAQTFFAPMADYKWGAGGGVARGNKSIALGQSAVADGDSSVVAGYNAWSAGGYNVSLGTYTEAWGIGSMALGNRAFAGLENSIAIGSGSSSRALRAVVIGADASAKGYNEARAQGSVVIGWNASSSADFGVALGASSVADVDYTVSVGSKDIKRRIVNVNDGYVNAGSTDAVNGNQLYRTEQNVRAAQTTADTAQRNVTAARSVADSAKSAADSALSKANTLSGLLSQASASGNVRVGGSNSGTLLDIRNSANASRKITGVADATLSTTSTEAVSGKQLNTTNSNVTAARSVADSAKTNADSALSKANTLSGLLSQTSASGNVRVGANNSGTVLDVRNSANAGRKITGVADATLSTTSTEAVSGKQLNATNVNVTAARSVADSAKINADSALTKANTLSGLLSQTSASGNVRLGAANSGTVLDVRNSANASRKITGVADAALSTTSTDAVTGRQLAATNTNVSTAQSDASAAKTAANSALTQVGALNGLLSQASASGNVRVGEKNSGTVLDVRNSANANRKLTGVADGVVSVSSYEAVNGRQLNATNDKVATVEGIARSAGTEAAAAKTDAAKALAETAALGGLVAQVSASGNVRLGEKNSGTTLDVRNSANANRRISGVADGAVSADSTEAVSGSQLHATNSRISDLESTNQYVSVGVDSLSERAEAALLGVAIGDSAKAGAEGGTALGAFATALGKNSVAVGRGAGVSGVASGGFAMGAGAQVDRKSVV